jgi:hypothetical protein
MVDAGLKEGEWNELIGKDIQLKVDTEPRSL